MIFCRVGFHFPRKFAGSAFRSKEGRIIGAKVCVHCNHTAWIDLTDKLGKLHNVSHMTQGFDLPPGVGLTPFKKPNQSDTMKP